MAGFLYYAAGEHGIVSYGDAVKLGVGYAFRCGESISSATVTGPDGGRGTIFCAADRPDSPPLGYSADTQDWRKLPAAEVDPANPPGNSAPAWVGMVGDRPPPPSLLARPQMVSGLDVLLEDGNTWTIPQTRMFSGDEGNPGWYVTLPRYTDVDESGKFIDGDIVKEYQTLWDASEAFAQHMAQSMSQADADGNVSLSVQDHFGNAVIAIQTNYYVARTELAMLRALSERTIDAVMLALIDWEGFMSLVDKKKVSADSGSVAGSEGSITAIGPPLAS